jgi:hypothetical protein
VSLSLPVFSRSENDSVSGAPPGVVFFAGNRDYFKRVEFALLAAQYCFRLVITCNGGPGATRPAGAACWKPEYGFLVQLLKKSPAFNGLELAVKASPVQDFTDGVCQFRTG